MQRTRLWTLAVSTLALAACNPFHREPVTEVSRDANVNSRWQASLVTPAALVGAVQINGSATMSPADNRDNTRLSLTLANATPGGVHPWQVHRGQCGTDEGVFGSLDAYAPLKVGDEGKGSASATIPGEAPTGGMYFVSVGASTANPETIVACGNLAPPAM